MRLNRHGFVTRMGSEGRRTADSEVVAKKNRPARRKAKLGRCLVRGAECQALSASTIALKVALGRMMAVTFAMSGW